MSRATKYTLELTLPNGQKMKGGIKIGKSTDAPTSFTQTYPDPQQASVAGAEPDARRVRTAKVLTSGDIIPKKKGDIEKVIAWGDVQTSYVHRHADGETYLTVDKKVRGDIFKRSTRMTGMGFVPSSEFAPHMFVGSHYFMTPQIERKAKAPDEADHKFYTILYNTLAKHPLSLLVKFVSGDREKYAVIYHHGEILMMSILIHTNYQRPAPQVQLMQVDQKKLDLMSAKVAKALAIQLELEKLVDVYESLLIEYIEKLKHAHRTGVKPTVTPRVVAKDPDDLFDMLDDL